MIPDVGAGTPMTAVWFIAAVFLLALTIISGISLALFSRALQKRDSADAHRDDRVSVLDAQIREQELKSLERDSEHQKTIYQLQVEMLHCQKECARNSVSKEEYLGDFMRIQVETREAIQGLRTELRDFVTRVHERVDTALASSHDVGAK